LHRPRYNFQVSLFPEHTITGLSLVQPPPVRRSAGLAWCLSLIAPGAGQIYCGATTRGIATLVVFAGAVWLGTHSGGSLMWIGGRIALSLYAFAGLDAYETAAEHNIGIDADAPDNPRVAAVLNLITNGFGYVYLGWKVGFATFFVFLLFWRSVGPVLPALGEGMAFALAAHAYVGGRTARAAIYGGIAQPADPRSRIPKALPWALSGTLLGIYFQLVLWVEVMLFLHPEFFH
jgi:hypothetical protein